MANCRKQQCQRGRPPPDRSTESNNNQRTHTTVHQINRTCFINILAGQGVNEMCQLLHANKQRPQWPRKCENKGGTCSLPVQPCRRNTGPKLETVATGQTGMIMQADAAHRAQEWMGSLSINCGQSRINRRPNEEKGGMEAHEIINYCSCDGAQQTATPAALATRKHTS